MFLKKSNLLKNPVIILIVFFQFLYSQEASKDSSDNSFIFLPVIYHSPETKLAGGIIAQYNYRQIDSPPNTRSSVLTPLIVYTQKKQFIGELGFDLYFKEEQYHLSGNVSYLIFPNTYFGIGNNTPEINEEKYSANNFTTSITFSKQLFPSINIGFEYEYQRLDITKKDSLLSLNGTIGNNGGTISGFGPVINLDTRDNVNFPSEGYYYEGSMLYYPSFLGSDFNFNTIKFDFRRYFTFRKEHVFALQGYSQFTNGKVPFNKLSKTGGSRILRGYFEGRYLDKHILFFQGEYRSPTWYKIGYVAFAGIGDVASKINKFDPADFKYSIGFGFRYMFIPKEKLNLRLDFGFVKDGFKFYMNIGEVF